MCDFEAPAAYVETMRRARKVHRCCECARSIQPGDRYQVASGVWDGRGASFKTCARCLRIRKAHIAGVNAVDPSDHACWLFGDLVSEVRDWVREEPKYLAAFRAAYKGGA